MVETYQISLLECIWKSIRSTFVPTISEHVHHEHDEEE